MCLNRQLDSVHTFDSFHRRHKLQITLMTRSKSGQTWCACKPEATFKATVSCPGNAGQLTPLNIVAVHEVLIALHPQSALSQVLGVGVIT